MTIGDKYGNQKDGLFVTHDDVEKRRLDRERAKKLSQETNRRRKALEDKKKLAAEREKRKISLELTKRRQKQSEATEKYQRSQRSSRSDRRPKSAYSRGTPSLDNILQQLRSGSTEINYGNETNSYHGTADSTNNRSKQPDTKMQEQNNALLQQHKLKTKQEFQYEITKNSQQNHANNNETSNTYSGLYDSLDGSAMATTDKWNITSPPMPADGYTNADLMAGSAHLSQQELSNSLSRLFIHNQQYNRANYDMPRAYSKQTFTSNREGQPMKIEDADDDELIFKPHPAQTFERDKSPLKRQPEQLDLIDSLEESGLDSYKGARDSTFDEDSLHGSTTPEITSPLRNEKENSFADHSNTLYNGHRDTADKGREFKSGNVTGNNQKHFKSQDNLDDERWKDDGYYFKSYRPRTAAPSIRNEKPHRNDVTIDVVASAGKPTPTKIQATEIQVVEPWSATHQPVQIARATRIVPRVSQGPRYTTPSAAPPVESEHINNNEALTTEKPKPKDTNQPKSILKKVSKYGPKSPTSATNYTAATIVRQQWVNDIGMTEQKTTLGNQTPPAPPKSVVWHEIQYDDGTSTSILGGVVQQPNATPSTPTTSTKSGGKASTKNKSGKGKAKAAPAKKGGKGSKESGGKKAKFADKNNTSNGNDNLPVSVRKPLTMTNAIHYSIHDKTTPSTPTLSSTTLPRRSKIAWKESENGVTLDNLKSTGSDETPEGKRQPKVEVVTSERTGNHVTIHVVTTESNINNNNNDDDEINLSKTPTDQEINQLWENVRSCIAKRPATSKPTNRTTIENQRYGPNPSARQNGSRTAWSTQPSTISTAQQQPSIVSIDGGMLMHDNTRGFNQYRIAAAQRRRSRRFIRPTSAAVNSTPAGRTNETYNFYMRHQSLLQQRRQKQYTAQPPSYPSDMLPRNYKTYPGVKQSRQLPYPSPKSSARDQQSNSTTAFLMAEALAEQNLSEEEIMQALESIQRKSFEAQKAGKALNPSALSMEEQRLLASLERLNSRLDEIESTVSSNPNYGAFNKTMPLPPKDNSGFNGTRRNQSAKEVRFQRGRDRY